MAAYLMMIRTPGVIFYTGKSLKTDTYQVLHTVQENTGRQHRTVAYRPAKGV